MTPVESALASDARASALQKLNAFFDRVYVLTIERNEERRTLFEAAHPSLDFEYVVGVDGSREPEERLQREYDDAAARRFFGRSLSPGQIGCALTHRMAYARMLDEGHRTALILEDDATFNDSAVHAVAATLEQLPETWELLYLHTQRPGENWRLDLKVRWVYPLLNASRLRRYDMDAVRALHSRPFTRNLRRAGKHWMALAYAVTARTARQFIEWQSPVSDVADGITSRFSTHPETGAYLSVPNLFLARGGLHSTIWNRPPRSARLAADRHAG